MEQPHWTSIITLHANQYSVEMMIANALLSIWVIFRSRPNSDTLRNNYFCLVFYAQPQNAVGFSGDDDKTIMSLNWFQIEPITSSGK